MIEHNMRMAPKQMANAFLVFMREKPTLKFMRRFIIMFMIATIGLLVLKLLAAGWTWTDATYFIVCFSWVAFGNAFTNWRLNKQMEATVGGKEMSTTLSPQGIIWRGEGIKSDSAKWIQVTKVMETATGFIVMLGSRKFLWLPFSGFTIPQNKVREFFEQQQIKLIAKPKYVI